MTNEQIITALLSTKTRGEASRLLGLSERQLYNRVNTPECAELLREVNRKVLDSVIETAITRLSGAVDVIAEIMDNESVDPKTRLGAAESLVRCTAKLIQVKGEKREQDSDDWMYI